MSEGKWKLKGALDNSEIIINKLIFKVGRHYNADLKTDSPLISRNHAYISTFANGMLYVTDCKSVNGTYINNKKITPMEIHPLHEGDEVVFGITQSLFDDPTFDGPLLKYKVIKVAENESPASDQNVPENTTVISTKNVKLETSLYTTVDDYIIISDEEEDDFSSSQIFHISQRINEASELQEDGPDPYKYIKEELMDLDDCNVIPAVDLTDEFDHFDSTSELINVLENETSKMCTQNLLEILDDTISSEPIVKENSMESKNEKNLKLQNSNKVKVAEDVNNLNMSSCTKTINQQNQEDSNAILIAEQTGNNKSRCSLSTKDEKSRSSSSNYQKVKTSKNEDPEYNSKLAEKTSEPHLQIVLQKSSTKKCVKPSIVEPHLALKTASRNKQPSKRKSFDKSTPNSSKKSRHSISVDSSPIDKNLKQEIQEKRKQKLKEIADKSKRSIIHPKIIQETAKGQETNSKNENLPINEKRPNKAPVKHKKDPRLNKPTEQKSNQLKNENIQDGTISSNLSNDNEVQWIGPYNNVARCSKPIPDSTVKEDRSSLIWKIFNTHQSHANYYKKQIDLNEEICKIVAWNVNWLIEQKQVDMSPPVNGDQPVMQVPLNFENYETYQSIILPLLMLELWQYVFQTTFNKEEDRDPRDESLRVSPKSKMVQLCRLDDFKWNDSLVKQYTIINVESFRPPVTVQLEHERVTDSTSSLDCTYKLSTAGVNAIPFRQDDYCLLELRFKDVQNVYGLTCFGYIKKINRPHSGNSVNFTVITRKLNKPILCKQVVLKIVANISCNLRLFRTLRCLEQSPLCQYVLNPKKLSSSEPIKSRSVRVTPNLNLMQKQISCEASEMALSRKPGFYLIKGPPGTGKSTVIISTIMEILYKSKGLGISPQLLITAPSNAAIDALILKLNRTRCELPEYERKIIRIVRVGPENSINELVNRFTLRYQSHKTMIIDRNLRKDYSEVENRMDMPTFLKQKLGQQYFYEKKITEERVLLGANIICTTLSSCVSYILQQTSRRGQLKFTACIVDEATQCTEMECLLPIQLEVDKFILVGDPQQLPAVICNKEAQQLGLGKSLFSRMFDNLVVNDGDFSGHYPVQTLCDQYRMKQEICDYPNRTFYEGKLKSIPNCFNPIDPQIYPYLVFNLSHSTGDDRSDYFNTDEILIICNILETLKKHIKPTCMYSIGIITPYKAQKELVAKRVAEMTMNPKVSITVNTVDSFQGMENDIIIISCVRYNANYFLANEQRLNVALTRAKQALYIIGNYSLFKQCRPLYDLREDAKKRKLLLDIKTNPRQMPSLHKQILVRS